MSNRLFQTIIHQMRDVVGRTIGIIDENGIVVACSDLAKIGESKQRIKEELPFSQSSMVYDGFTYRFIAAQEATDSIAFVEGDDLHAEKMCHLISISLGNIKGLYDEKYDKSSFIKSILLDNILPSDIYVKSNELHFSSEESRVVIVIKFLSQGSFLPYEVISRFVTDKVKDYVISISEQDIVIVKEVARNSGCEETEAFAEDIVKSLNAEYEAKAVIGISSVVDNLKDLARAYKEAKISLEVGKVFDIEKPVMAYENLGIGRLIYR